MRYVFKILHVVSQELFFWMICLLTQLIKLFLYFTLPVSVVLVV